MVSDRQTVPDLAREETAIPTADFDLQPWNTLACPSRAEWGVVVRSRDALLGMLDWGRRRALPVTVLGGGSNVVPRTRVRGLVIVNRSRGRVSEARGEQVLVTVESGENWDDLVQFTVAQGWWGLENLVLIPGSVGAAPVQNIGAYGMELCESLLDLEVCDQRSGEVFRLAVADCALAYRDSVFKQARGRDWIILSVRLSLGTRGCPRLEYADLQRRWEQAGAEASPAGVARVVAALRREKLPDPAQIPNAGSFFKNPVIEPGHYAELKQVYPDLVAYPLPSGQWKLAAAWLIDRLGWRGRVEQGCGCHERQALVLVNPGRCPGEACLAMASRIQQDVEQAFGVGLDMEPRVLGEALDTPETAQ